MQETQIIEADWTWTDGAFKSNVQIVVSPVGRIEHVGELDLRATHRLRDRALIPGFVNAHSHAFQRGLRGVGEHVDENAGSFWSWRDRMYQLAENMDADRFYELTLSAFREMLSAGITTVGEFHYLHHDRSCRGHRFDDVVLTAARDAGIRLVLLQTYYRTGDIGRALSPAQRRFGCGTVAEYRRQLEQLWSKLDTHTQTLGVVAHSIRAVPIEEIAALHELSRETGMVFHMHVEEQRREIDDCRKAYGKAPLALLNERLTIDQRFTAVHCTHSTTADLEDFAVRGGSVCICPLTEANLGDGLADVARMLRAGARLCVGTDSNARISMIEELRWLELGQRLKHESRGVLYGPGEPIGPLLLRVATGNGAAALGVPTGAICPGQLADFASIDLSAPSLAGWTPDTLLDMLFFGAENSAIAGACVGGRWIPAHGTTSH